MGAPNSIRSERITGSADNVDRRESLPPVIGAVRKVEPRLQRVRAEKMPLTELVDLLPLEAVAPPVLPVEEAAFRGLQQQPVRSRAVRQNIGIIFLVVDLRGKQAVRSRKRTDPVPSPDSRAGAGRASIPAA